MSSKHEVKQRLALAFASTKDFLSNPDNPHLAISQVDTVLIGHNFPPHTTYTATIQRFMEELKERDSHRNRPDLKAMLLFNDLTSPALKALSQQAPSIMNQRRPWKHPALNEVIDEPHHTEYLPLITAEGLGYLRLESNLECTTDCKGALQIYQTTLVEPFFRLSAATPRQALEAVISNLKLHENELNDLSLLKGGDIHKYLRFGLPKILSKQVLTHEDLIGQYNLRHIINQLPRGCELSDVLSKLL